MIENLQQKTVGELWQLLLYDLLFYWYPGRGENFFFQTVDGENGRTWPSPAGTAKQPGPTVQASHPLALGVIMQYVPIIL
jgi:hypothetical protein